MLQKNLKLKLPRTLLRFIAPSLVLSAAFFAPAAGAHLAAGEDKVVGPYIVDFGYAPKFPQAGTGTAIALNLADAKTSAPIPFTEAWVRISDVSGTVLAGNFYPTLPGNTSLSLTLPRDGAYALTVQFFKDTDVLAQTNFMFAATALANTPVVAKASNLQGVSLFALVLTAVLLLAIVFFRRRDQYI